MTHRCTTPAAMAVIKYHHQIWLVLVVSVVWLAHDACALPAMGGMNTLAGLSRYGTRRQADMKQLLLNELLKNVNEDPLSNELKKYQRQQPNYLSKWPGLRDLLLIADYGENESDSEGAEDSYEALNTRLRQLTANAVDGIDDTRADNHPVVAPTMPLKKNSQSAAAAFKDHGIKKNIQYMSPCHFKICNMGRKRNARSFED